LILKFAVKHIDCKALHQLLHSGSSSYARHAYLRHLFWFCLQLVFASMICAKFT